MAALDKIYLSGVGYDLQDVKAPETWVTTAATVGSGDYSGVRLYEKRRGSGSTLYNNFEMMFANINGTSVLGSNSFSLQPTLSAGTGIDITNNVISVTGGGGGGGSNVVELTQAQYDALVTGGTVDADTFYIITDATEIDASSFYTTAQTSSSTQISTALALKADAATTSSATEVSTALAAKQNTLSAGTGIDITNDVISVTGGGGGGTIDASLDSTSPNAVANSAITNGINAVSESLNGYVTTNTAQNITGQKTFVGTKMVYFDQSTTSDKLGFTLHDNGGGEFGAFELNPSGIIIDSVKRPLMTLNHYRGTSATSRNVQTTIGIRQYDYASKAAYNFVAPLPENAKTPFSLTTSIKNLWIPIGVKSDSSTIIQAENSGVIDLSTAFAAKADAATTSSATEVSTALAAKQNTLSAGTGIDITNDVISVTGGGGGGGTIDASLDSSSPNAVANSAITNAVNSKVSDIAFDADSGVKRFIRFSTPNTFNKFILQNFKINGTPVLKDGYVSTSNMDNYQLIETSAITTTLSSGSTDAQVPSAKAVYDIIGDIESLLQSI